MAHQTQSHLFRRQIYRSTHLRKAEETHKHATIRGVDKRREKEEERPVNKAEFVLLRG